MKLPRDVSGDELVSLLCRHYDYRVVRQKGSHMRLLSTVKGAEHRLSVPRHSQIKVGTLHTILSLVARYLEMDVDDLSGVLFR